MYVMAGTFVFGTALLLITRLKLDGFSAFWVTFVASFIYDVLVYKILPK